MVKHKDIQDPDDYSEKEYQLFEEILFSGKSSSKELEDVCMTLAHLPTKRAQDLLTRFKESERAEEVEWLEIALDEGKFHYLQPNNEKESRDFLSLKVIREKDDYIIELMKKKEDYELNIKKFEIELEALKKMQKEGSAIKENISALKDLIKMEKNCHRETKDEIEFEEKLQRKIRESIDTERYKDIDPMYMDDIIF
jgi:gas vesicle protein